MHVIHGVWIPEQNETYVQSGAFYLWVETDAGKRGSKAERVHPRALRQEALAEFLKAELGVKEMFAKQLQRKFAERYFTLPTIQNVPVKSYELLRYAGEEPPAEFTLQSWQVCCYPVPTGDLIGFLNDLHFLLAARPANLLLGADVLFWHQYAQVIKDVLLKDQYIPALKYQELTAPKGKKKEPAGQFELHPAWEILSEKYEAALKHYVDLMPLICAAGSAESNGNGELYAKERLLRHFAENVLHVMILQASSTAKFEKQVAGTLLYDCLYPHRANIRNDPNGLKTYQQWARWRHQLAGQHAAAPFTLGFQLHEAPSAKDPWLLQFLINSKQDPSLRLTLDDYWYLDQPTRKRVQQSFGKDIERHVLLNLGQAARMYPKIWEGLETDKPTGLQLELAEAFAFLKEYAWILEDAGYKVLIPAWWTPQGRRRAKIRVKSAVARKKVAQAPGKGLLSLHAIIEYRYELSIGGEAISPAEWNQLVNAKTPLVQFRGAWLELDGEKMRQMLEFWQQHADEQPQMDVLNFLKMSANEELEFEHDDALREMLAKFHDHSRFELIPDPPKFHGKLRDYQKRGVSWIQYLEQLGLNGCLADDMGLGKTIQVIAHLINEREAQTNVRPTLLLAPTSVLGNWQKEVARFAPHLTTWIHHGAKRLKQTKAFQKTCQSRDLVISSYALARKDEKLFGAVEWERIVLDEAQNIKNPLAEQTKAILNFNAAHRLALTGTPVENRLLDLWSIFNFLNQGYLGHRTGFRKTFEIPIQKENDRSKAQMLKRLAEPFILRRVKTDQEIIKDLPEKVEQKVFCNLSKEQASLYEAVVKDVTEQLENAEGIGRKGLVLSSLMKLKQICNHPAQFLQDNSAFARERSHKLDRLAEMLEEVIENGESLLIFSQFREICDALEHFIGATLHYPTYLIHGGTSRAKREQMIAEFQDPESDPAVFILSLKAGGVGITLTKANHVFHFDRWWNPAVENQATDRAFRIGQAKNVFVHKFIALGTLEERIDQMIEDKKSLSDAIVGADESWLTELDNDAFEELIALNRSAILE